jgi:tRNA pseudouridine38-40 synthase
VANIQPALLPESGFFRVKIEITYDGTNFNGYAKQLQEEGLRTVQVDLESALSMICHTPILTVVAGRTDAGVHATQQFVHADIPNEPFQGKTWDIDNWPYLLNRILRDDVRVKSVVRAAPYFHARFSAIERSYEYKIADGFDYLPPLKRIDVASWFRKLDENKMNEACSHFIGDFDFFSFCKFRVGSSTIRCLKRFEWVRNEEGYLTAFITADAFCYNMVRNLVGAAVCIGEGRFDKEWMIDLLHNHRRPSESYSFPARGLTLTSIVYPPDDELLSRAEITIARRDQARTQDDE